MRGCACRGTAGFAHVSCLAEQAKILVAEAEENNLDNDRFMPRWNRWYECSLCEQEYHGVVFCALGGACWKTYGGRREGDWAHMSAMRQLGLGLSATKKYEDALSVCEAELSVNRRLGADSEEFEENMRIVQGNLAINYEKLGRLEDALRLKRDVYSGTLKLFGEEHGDTLLAASNYAASLLGLKRFEEAKALLRRMLPVVRRVFGDDHDTTLRARTIYAAALYYEDAGATFADLREAVATLEDTVRIARRVLGGTHPLTTQIEKHLRESRRALSTHEDVGSISDAVGAL